MLGPLCTAEAVDDYRFGCQVFVSGARGQERESRTCSNLGSAKKSSGGFGYVRENTYYFFQPQVVDFLLHYHLLFESKPAAVLERGDEPGNQR